MAPPSLCSFSGARYGGRPPPRCRGPRRLHPCARGGGGDGRRWGARGSRADLTNPRRHADHAAILPASPKTALARPRPLGRHGRDSGGARFARDRRVRAGGGRRASSRRRRVPKMAGAGGKDDGAEESALGRRTGRTASGTEPGARMVAGATSGGGDMDEGRRWMQPDAG
ncbi:hypothetical protein ACP70R_033702 [Stipagrostis hirtigluma subsp. patula]